MMAGDGNNFAASDVTKCPRSLSMEELSSLAREIWSPRSTESFSENESIHKSKNALDSESRTDFQGNVPSNYHSWPKKKTRKKKLRKYAYKTERLQNFSQNKIAGTHDLARCNSSQRFAQIKESSEKRNEQDLVKSYMNPFYNGESTIKVTARSRSWSDIGTKIMKGTDISVDDRNSHLFPSMDLLLTKEEKDNKESNSVIHLRNKRCTRNLFYHEYNMSVDKQLHSSLAAGNMPDYFKRFESSSDRVACHNDISDDPTKAKDYSKLPTGWKGKYIHSQKIMVQLQKSSETDYDKSFCTANDLRSDISSTFKGRSRFNVVECTEATSKLQMLSSRHCGKRHEELTTEDGTKSEIIASMTSNRNRIWNNPLAGNHSEESSESSDSGVGNIQCDILFKNWNEPKVSGPLFKKRLEILKQWYIQFDHDQKNIILKMLLENSELPQMHMLSEIMEPVLHKDCPPNCQDFLSWLPAAIIHRILTFLDPVSLAHASQVSKMWYEHCEDGRLWKKFCSYPDMQLSPAKEREQIIKYTNKDGSIQWKKVFVLRYCLRRNWLNGKCKIRTFTGHTQAVFCVQFDETRIVSGSSDNTIKVWDIKSGRTDPLLTLVGHSGTVRCLHLNGNRLVSGSADATIKVWDLVEGCDWSSAACKVTMVGHVQNVRCLQVDGEKIVSGSYDTTLKLWDIKTGVCKTTYRGHCAPVLCVQFDNEKIVSGSADRTIKVWSIKGGYCINTLAGHTEAVTCLQFNSHRIFSGSLDCSLKFWDLCTSQCSGTIDWIRSEGHTRVVRCLQADSWKIVSAGDDKALKIWSLETGKRFFTLRNHTDGVTCLQFNDHMLVSGSYDKSVKLWDFSPNEEMT